ncbi:hypothetical protein CFP56_014822 [Quercus suber]|uniref:EGF-like domain-containing protein n=1 Tax=Quercus suber TaxID=58331 RepID=A0AAW0KTZ4_QUESU
MWDYSYLDQTSKSNNNNSMFKSYDTSQEGINLYILYPTAGLWIIGLRHPVDLNNQSSPRTMMTISTVYCPNQCSGHGICEYNDDLSESADYSYCSCDRNHGGFDCSVTLLSKAVYLTVLEPCRSNDIIIVLSIGALTFLIGWLMQLCTRCKSFSFPVGSSLKITERWQSSKDQLLGLMMAIYRYFRWGYVLLGLIAMSMAAISWTKEDSETYWIWHSIWHISIYTSAFFFICSKAKTQNVQEAPAAASYELTRQESFASV